MKGLLKVPQFLNCPTNVRHWTSPCLNLWYSFTTTEYRTGDSQIIVLAAIRILFTLHYPLPPDFMVPRSPTKARPIVSALWVPNRFREGFPKRNPFSCWPFIMASQVDVQKKICANKFWGVGTDRHLNKGNSNLTYA